MKYELVNVLTRVAIILPILPKVMEGSFHPSKEGFLEGFESFLKGLIETNLFYTKVLILLIRI